MKSLRYCIRPFAILLLITLGGCTLLQPQGDALGKRVDALVADKRYGDAQELLGNIPHDSADFKRYAERRKQVDNLAAQYERKVVEDARQLILQERWAQALDLYDLALERMPHSSKLHDGLADLNSLQQQRITGQENVLLINKGEWLLVVLPTYKRITQIAPRDGGRERQYRNIKNIAEDTAEELSKVGTAALESGDYELAERTITLATRLSDKDEIRQAQQLLEQGRSKRARELRSNQEQRLRDAAMRDQDRSDTIVELQRGYDTAIQERDYITARTLLAKLRTYVPEVVAQRGYESDLKRRIDVEGERLYEEGVTYYGHSEFEKARDTWQKVLELVPNHAKAKESLVRVNKVLGRIEHLRKKQRGE